MKDTKSLIPPNSKESEMMVLGSMLTSINSLNIGADSLLTTDFYYPEHQIIFDILKTAYVNDKPADVHLVCEELKRIGKLKTVGGAAYVTSVAQYAGTSVFIEEYVEIVQNKAILRRMIQAAKELEKQALDNPSDVHALLDESQQTLFSIGQAAQTQGGVLLRDLLSGSKASSKMPFLKEIQMRQEEFQVKGPQEAGITGIPTHFLDLDKMINGLGHSNLAILAARPAMGKTALALNIAANVCFKNGLPVGIFSLEMSAEQLLHRLICSQAEVESDKLRTGNLNGTEFQKIVGAVNAMQKVTMIIDDQPGLKITDLRARARRMKESHGIQLLIVDYLQLISGSGQSKSAENRQNEIAEISRMLKNLARELNIPVICLSQLSRKVEERPGHRPMMSDLRESGCLTGDASLTEAITGTMHTIQELADRETQTPIWIRAIDPKTNTFCKARLIKAFYSGRKKVYELTTQKGKVLKASSNHPFWKGTSWTKLEDLQIGDAIGIQLSSACTDPYYDVITKITPLQEEDVYDATVEEVHNFVANDLIVHNSIEQDSDVVIFLLRREYYDPYDKPGMAEVIVAKNRHGAVGSVFLVYRKELAQFGNYTGLNTGNQSAGDPQEDPFAAFSPQ